MVSDTEKLKKRVSQPRLDGERIFFCKKILILAKPRS